MSGIVEDIVKGIPSTFCSTAFSSSDLRWWMKRKPSAIPDAQLVKKTSDVS